MIYVLHVIPGLAQGGAERMLYNLTVGGSPVFKHVVLCLDDGQGYFHRQLVEGGVLVCWLDLKKLNPTAILGTLSELRANYQFDVVMSWLHQADTFSILLKPFFSKASFIWNIRNGASFGSFSRSVSVCAKLNKYFSHLVPNSIIYNSNSNKLDFEKLGYCKRVSKVIFNGISYERFHSDSQGDQFSILIAARWDPVKNITGMFEVVSLLNKDFNIQVTLVGAGMNSDNHELVALVETYGIADRISLLGPIDDVRVRMRQSDCLLLLSHSEGFSNVLLEAQSVGLPAICTDVGENRLVAEEELIVPSGPLLVKRAILAIEHLYSIKSNGLEDWTNYKRKIYLNNFERFCLAKMHSMFEDEWRVI